MHKNRFCRKFVRSRLRLLSWPLEVINKTGELRKADFPLSDRAKSTRYPLRAMRYWWAVCAIRDEYKKRKNPLVIVDAGCERGMLKRLTPAMRRSRWIGLDKNIRHGDLKRVGYDQCIPCDLTQGIPLRDDGADIVVSLHVLEHMPEPDVAIREFVRILRPGGVMLIAVPVLPRILARMRQRQFNRQLRSGERRLGGHVYAFSPGILCGIAKSIGLEPEFMAGSHLLRWSGNRLENFKFWARLNQMWGALFPALGRELFIMFRFEVPS